MKLYYDKDVDLSVLRGQRIAVIGYGSQGHAHALNLKDSGLDVVVGLRKDSASWTKAQAAGLEVTESADAARQADFIMLLAPDQHHVEIYQRDLEPNLTRSGRPPKVLAFAHGFNIHFGQILPPKEVDVVLIAPKSPGHIMRRVFTEGGGVPCLLAVQQDASGRAKELALAYAKGIGGTRAGVIETTFQEETETDLFGEQAVLCGGVTELVKAGFETLVEAGYQPEIAYFECLHELKLIVDLFYQGGISGMYYSVSDTAEYGGMTRGPKIINEKTKQAMREILQAVQSGQFAREWILENQAGRPVLNALRRQHAELLIEKVGKPLREMASWVQKASH